MNGVARGIVQLAFSGEQDIYLVGNPQFSLWKAVYKTHTHFAIESIHVPFHEKVQSGNRVHAEIVHHADLVNKCYIAVTLPEQNTEPITLSSMIDTIELEIGEQIIEIHQGEFLDIWYQLITPIDKKEGFKEMTQKGHIYIPLLFFFCNKASLSLPLIALQHTKVRIWVQFKKVIKHATLWVDYVYLDNEERNMIAESVHDMMVTHVEYKESRSNKMDLQFKNACKELIWKTNVPYETATIMLNNHERIVPRKMDYFQVVQPYQNHTSVPDKKHNISLYSFSLYPENEYQPSGTCNFSKIDHAELILTGDGLKKIQMWALSWNVLRIVNGEASFQYPN